MMARAATSPELALFRTNGQWAKLSLFIYTPATVYSARLSTIPTSNDQVRSIAYSSGSGTLGDVLTDMTMMVGTTAGGWDIGFVRVRSITGSVINIGETSEIVWAVNQYLTIVDDFEIWLRKLSFLGGAYNLDNEIPYASQYTDMLPQPVLGPYLAALKLTSSTVTLAMDAGSSWVPTGTITGYAWVAKGPASVTFSNAAVANPTLTFSAVGTYRIGCTVSTATQSNTGYRYVRVYNDANPLSGGFVPGKIDISRDGGCSFTVDLYDPAVLSGVRPRALVVLVAEDHYGNTIQSIGPIPGYESVVASGRIASGSIVWSPEQSKVTFTVQGPAGQLQVTPNWPFTLMDTHAVIPGASPLPADWLHMPGLTVDKALWCWSNWRSTMARCMDVYPSGDTRHSFSASGNLGSSWEQIRAFSDQIGAIPVCDRYGRLFIQIDPNLLSISDRSAIPVVMEISKGDWSDEIDLERHEMAITSWVQTAGFYYNGSTFDVMMSAAPGNALGMRGNTQTKNNLLFSSQAQANELTGRLLMRANNEYPTATIPLPANNRLIDIAPQQYVTLTLAAGDTPWGVSFTAKKFIPRRVSYTYDTENGMLTASIECEGETFDGPAATIIPPKPGNKNINGGGHDPNPFGNGIHINPWPYTNPPKVTTPPILPPDNACLSGDQSNGPYNLWISGVLDANTPALSTLYGPFPSTVRASSSSNKSSYELNGTFYKREGGVWVETTDYGQFEVYGVNENGNTVVTGINNGTVYGHDHQRTGTFLPIGNTPVQTYRLRYLPSGQTSPYIDQEDMYLGGSYGEFTSDWNPTNMGKETALDGSTHYTIDYNYSLYGVWEGGFSHNYFYAILQPGMRFRFPNEPLNVTYRVKIEMVFVFNPSAGGYTVWSSATGVPGAADWRALQGFYNMNQIGISPAYISGDRITGEFTFTTGGTYGSNEITIELYERGGVNVIPHAPFTGSMNINLWVSRNDGQEFESIIDSVYLRNVCPL